ncbi:MAG: putative nucleotidyltransferase substrate binding domain-containing protein [Bdellovibrionia bacterium]
MEGSLDSSFCRDESMMGWFCLNPLNNDDKKKTLKEAVKEIIQQLREAKTNLSGPPPVCMPLDQGKKKHSNKPLKIKTQFPEDLQKNLSPKTGAESYSGISAFFKEKSEDKQKLEKIRAEGIREFNLLLEKSPNGQQVDTSSVTKKLTDQMKKFISDMIDDEASLLEKRPEIVSRRKNGVPKPKFSVFSMGSIPRGEAGLYTDMEIGFIIEENTPENQFYISKLTQRVADRVHLLGEEDGMHLDVADNAPSYQQFHDRYTSPDLLKEKTTQAILSRDFSKIPTRGTRLLTATPEKLASYMDTRNNQSESDESAHSNKTNKNKSRAFSPSEIPYDDGDSIRGSQTEDQFWMNQANKPYFMREKQLLRSLPDLLRNVTLVNGDSNLYSNYLDNKNKVLDQKIATGATGGESLLRHKIALDGLNASLAKKAMQGRGFLNGQEDAKVDLKRDLYRTAEQILTGLGFYYDTKSQNTVDIARELGKRGIISSSLAKSSEDLIQFLMELRLKSQIKLKRQGKDVYLDNAQFEQDIAKLDTDIIGRNRKS